MAGGAGPMSREERLEVDDVVLRVGQAMLLGALNAGETIALDGIGNRWYRVYWWPGVPGYVWAGLVQIAPDAECSRLPSE